MYDVAPFNTVSPLISTFHMHPIQHLLLWSSSYSLSLHFFLSHSHFFHISHFLLNQKEKSSSKTKHKKTEQRNNVEHEAIILKDKRQEKSNTFLLSHVSMGYQIQ